MQQHRAERWTFTGSGGETLAAWLDLPVVKPRAYAVFAHCFTCGKDVLAASRISRRLAAHGIAVLRFDFTGLGESGGDFADSTYSSNVDDLVRAADHLREHRSAPTLLIGHSLGGAAVIAAAARIPEVCGVVTIGAPCGPEHVTHLLGTARSEIEAAGQAEVTLAGRSFRVRREFLNDIVEQRQRQRISSLRRPLLVLHSPLDDTVGIDNARLMFDAARHPKSFVALDGADHLLSTPTDAEYAADVIAAWAGRYVVPATAGTRSDDAPDHRSVVVAETGQARFTQRVSAGQHSWYADEPESSGGSDTAPDPYQLLLSALGACTSMTLRIYAERKGWDLRRAAVTLNHDRIHAEDCDSCETPTGQLDRIVREVHLDGELDGDQRATLLAIADKCPVHRTLHSEIVIETDEV
jgi:uncharacterized OsmC-like protein/fermentation-respiration switch protein FrsA (DUF1100 family)